MTDTPRLLELRRRVQEDPASIAFAQLAEECRRAGANDEAVRICRAGLQSHPDYLSARVTLGRALFELGRLEEAERELVSVLEKAADNLAANRALAEVFQQQGRLPEALTQYRRALELARFDPDLQQEIQRMETIVEPSPASPPASASVAVEDLFDFDTLLSQLGGRTRPRDDFAPLTASVVPAASVLDRVELREDDGDPFSVLERKLRENSEEDAREQRLLAELEDWLLAIAVDRGQRPDA